MTVTMPERTTTAPPGAPVLGRPVGLRPTPGAPARIPPAPPRCLPPPAPALVGGPWAGGLRGGDLRLTRRGRLAVTVAVLAGVFAVGIVARGASPPAAGRPGGGASVVVQPGDTLWGIAVRTDPLADPRVTVARIADLNRLTGAIVRPGQTLRLPGR